MQSASEHTSEKFLWGQLVILPIHTQDTKDVGYDLINVETM